MLVALTPAAAALPPTDARHAMVANQTRTIVFQAGTADPDDVSLPQRNFVRVSDAWFVGLGPATKVVDDVTLEAGPGCVAYQGAVYCQHSDDLIEDFRFFLGNGDDQAFLSGLDHRAEVYGDDGNDALGGGDMADTIDGGSGDDKIFLGGGGADVAFCGRGDADIVYVDGADQVDISCETVRPARECSNGLDDDGDGAADYGPDVDCDSREDNSESFGAPPAEECDDGVDNDSDGKVDYPGDPGCSSASDDVEGDPADATTRPATELSDLGARLNGTLDPKGVATSYWFRWGQDPSLAVYSVTPAETTSASEPFDVSRSITGLQFGTTYYFQLVASNGRGLVAGQILSFKTADPSPPEVATGNADVQGSRSAAVAGTVDPNGRPAVYWVEYSRSPDFSPYSVTSSAAAGGGTDPVLVSQQLSGLQPDSEYHYRIAARHAYSGAPLVRGAAMSFRTASARQCEDGVDNDSDGRTDHPADAGCSSADDDSESPDPQPDPGTGGENTSGGTADPGTTPQEDGGAEGKNAADTSVPTATAPRTEVLGVRRANPGRLCRGLSRRGRQSPFARCVRALAKLQAGQEKRPQAACRRLSKRKRPTQRRSDFAACVLAGTRYLTTRS